MNAPLSHSDLRPDAAESELALARSRCIDAFARLECRVALAARRLELPISRDCLGRRVAALAEAKPSPALSKANVPELSKWVTSTESLIAQRASLVHSAMELGNYSGKWKASFANVVDIFNENPVALLMTVEDLQRLRQAVLDQTARLGELIKGMPPLSN